MQDFAAASSVNLYAAEPNTSTIPSVLVTKCVIIPIKVVFPAPFGPNRAKKSPEGTDKSTPFKATNPF